MGRIVAGLDAVRSSGWALGAVRAFDHFNVHHFVVNVWQHYPLVRSAVGALVFGAIGGGAYITAVLLGFLGDETLKTFQDRFSTTRKRDGRPVQSVLNPLSIGLFVGFGALVAFVFQSAQGKVFAPIQAFVLGATWTTVVAQMLSNAAKGDWDKNHDLVSGIRTVDKKG